MKKGLTLIEVMVVIGVIAVLAVMAVPALARIAPYAELRGEARYLATAMRQARLKAANSHKPVRVVADCSKREDEVCTLRTYMAVFSNTGEFSGWTATPSADSVHEFAASVTIRDNSNLNRGLGATVGTGANVFWAVFLPSSRMIGSHAPFQLTLESSRVSATRTLTVDGVTGRAIADDSTQP